MTNKVDILEIPRGLVVAPAGCGKTQLLADALARHEGSKPILVLTHTHAGVAALRWRLNGSGVPKANYRLATIDGWAMGLIKMFPERSGHAPGVVGSKPNYRAIREAACNLLKAGHLSEILKASYARLLVDEYQDCSIRQHAIVYYASRLIPTCVVGDEMQAIFGFGDDPLAKWNEHVVSHFSIVDELAKPWRWINAQAEPLGDWLLDVRRKLLAGDPIDLGDTPEWVTWIRLDGSARDHERRLKAGRFKAPTKGGTVAIIGEATSPPSQRRFASQTPGAVTVESVDLRDLVSFAGGFDITSPGALQEAAEFAQAVMTNIGAADLVSRVGVLRRGRARKQASSLERAALAFEDYRTYDKLLELVVEMNRTGGVRAHRPDVLRAWMAALRECAASQETTLPAAVVRQREQNRLHGRKLPGRAVGSTLLLKGLEADVVVILDAERLNAKNLYVALTRGSRRVVVCSRSRVLNPQSRGR